MKGYNIHDNADIPFHVIIDKKKVMIHKARRDFDKLMRDKKAALEIKNYINVWIGLDPLQPEYDGNTILVQTDKNNYIFISGKPYRFTLDEPVLAYYSPVGNSDVPYPYIITENRMYLLIEDVWIARNYRDPYVAFYNLSKKEANKLKKSNKINRKNIKI